MKPVKFKQCNVIYAENQPEYQPLPAYKNKSDLGEVVNCWEISFIERLKVLFTGKVYVSLLSFNRPLTPSFLSTSFNKIKEMMGS